MDYKENNLEQWERDKEYIEKNYHVKIVTHFSHEKGFAEGGEIAVLGFIFGAIAGGFLSEAGKDLWLKVKSLSQEFIQNQSKNENKKRTEVIAIFAYDSYQIIASLSFEESTKNHLTGTNPEIIQLFWNELPSQLSKSFKLIDNQNSSFSSIKALELCFNHKDNIWTVFKHKDKVEIQ